MRVNLLGELEVYGGDDAPILLTAAKLRALVAVLALDVGHPVSAERLVDALWGDDPPPASKNGLQALVSKLRRALGTTDAVSMRAGGYVLDVEPDDIDVHRYERLVTEARDADDRRSAVARYLEAERLWRGEPLAEFAYEDFASNAITRLVELHLTALAERIEAQLELGAHQAAIPELEAMVAAQPLRERLRGLLMLALYRAGRQADALRAFQDGRTILADELGLDPSPELRELEAAILAQDDALAADPNAAPAPAPPRAAIATPLTPLVGRSEELDALARLLDEHRLVTLVGPGGVGKTRLAVEIARERSATMEDGGCLVELAPFGDPADVRTAIASALDLPDPARLVELVGDRELLLVLDNCEHVITAAAEVADELLRRCPRLVLLATSREGLRIGGEVIWPVPPLGIDDAAVLFVTRASAGGATLQHTPDERAIVEEICTRLDGLPLAIELAAARTRAFPVRQLASRLHDRFRLLTGGSRTALPRQQTLRAVVDWSYELLFEDEQRVFERLSVFPGGCDLATAEAVCADAQLPAEDLADIVNALLDKSLVVAVPAGDELRVTQLQTLAQYGREKLAERGDAKRIRDAMAAYFADVCRRSPAAFVTDEQRAWLVRVDRDRENLRAALEWAVDCGDAETALTIAGGASWFHWLSGTIADGRRWIDAACAVSSEHSDVAGAFARTGRALLAFQAGVRDGVDDDLDAALAVFAAAEDPLGMRWTYSYWAEVAAARGDVEEAIRRRRWALDFLAAQPGDLSIDASAAYGRAKLAQLEDDLAGAEHWYRTVLTVLDTIDLPVMRAMTVGQVAEFDERGARYAEAVALLDEGIALCGAIGLRGLRGTMQARLGWALLHEGDVERAGDSLRLALDSALRLENNTVAMLSLAGLAVVGRREGRDDDARAAAIEALERHARIGPRTMSARISAHADLAAAAAASCLVLAAIAAERGESDEASLRRDQADELSARAGVEVPAFVS